MKTVRRFSAVLSILFTLSFAGGAVAQTDSIESVPDPIEAYVQIYSDLESVQITPGAEYQSVRALSTTVLIAESDEDAIRMFAAYVDSADDEPGLYELTRIDDLGDEAYAVSPGEDQELEQMEMVFARQGNVVVVSVTLNWSDAPGLPADVIRHIFATGPSTDDVQVDSEGAVTGGWADAFPQPEDIDELNGYDPAPVVEFELSPEVATPATTAPVTVATPAS